jgi:hypothetical protein
MYHYYNIHVVNCKYLKVNVLNNNNLSIMQVGSDNMKEFFTALWLSIGSLLGIEEEKTVKPETIQEIPKTEVVAEDQTPPTVAADSSNIDTGTENVTEPKAERDVVDTQLEYEAPEEAPWMSPVQGFEPISESVQKGEEGQVSTIWGNGSQGQTERSMDHPRDLQVDSKGNIYFVDGSQHTAKLRMFDGEKNTTIVDLVNNKITRRSGYFASAGLAIIHDNVYISSTEDVFSVENGRITQLTPKITNYMKAKKLENIYRIEPYKDYLYIMFFGKSKLFHIARYNINGGDVEEIIPSKPMPSPYSFYVHGENEIFIGTTNGYVLWETLFPRSSKVAYEFYDHKTEVADIWIGNNDSLYMVAWKDQAESIIYENPIGVSVEDVIPLIGSRRGFTDGFYDEVEMDYPLDFVWDGNGYLFADMGNHSIRKLWTNISPMEK